MIRFDEEREAERARLAAENARLGEERAQVEEENARITAEHTRLAAEHAQLMAECARLREENARLRREIEDLRRQCGVEAAGEKPQSSQPDVSQFVPLTTTTAQSFPESVYTQSVTFDSALPETSVPQPAQAPGAVTNRSSPEEKIALFRSLFRGREDVYARRWRSEKTGKSGYQPVCGNEWNPWLCDKRTTKCAACKNRKFSPLTDRAVRAHLEGRAPGGGDTVGIYPLTEDDGCYFLAMDFDGAGWREDVSAVRRVCDTFGLPVLAERSRSGLGGHLWFFFEDKIPARVARKFGSLLLGGAMRVRHDIGFSAYDRLFPNQDFLPKGGLGNLIALPLQGGPRRRGNSVFVDENFEVYPDQWRALSAAVRLTSEFVNETIRALSMFDDLGEEPAGQNDAGKTPKAGRTQKREAGLTADDFSPPVRVVCSNMIFVQKAGLSERALSAIKRLGAYPNPEFYRAQKMRLPIYDKPRLICAFEEDETSLAIPRGRLDALRTLLKEAGATMNLMDERNPGQPVAVEFAGTLREEQQRAFSALAARDTGVLSATTAFGKTVVGARLIAEKKRSALVLVHTSALLNQWKEALTKFLSFGYDLPKAPKTRGRKKELSHVGRLGATKNTLGGKIDVATIQSLGGKNGVKDLVKQYGLVLVDECHHVPAFLFEQVLKAAAAKYVYGLTATPVRADGRQKSIFMQCGEIAYRIDARDQAEKRLFSHVTVPRFTDFRMPLAADGGLKTLNRIFSELIIGKNRNRMIVEDVVAAMEGGRMPIVLTERTEHARLLTDEIEKRGVKTFLLVGKESAKTKREKLAQIAAAKPPERFAIVAIGRYVGEGFDFARLDTLFLAMPISWKGKLAQYAGRLHRDYAGKNEVIIYDYVDLNVAMLENMYHRRLRGYHEIGYEVRPGRKGAKRGILYDKDSFRRVFDEDFSAARDKVVLVSPALAMGRVSKFLRVYQSFIDKPAVTVVTRAPGTNAQAAAQIERLTKAGIAVDTREDLHLRCAVIGSSLVWYGSIHPLGPAGETDSILRFDSREIAETLLAQIGSCV